MSIQGINRPNRQCVYEPETTYKSKRDGEKPVTIAKSPSFQRCFDIQDSPPVAEAGPQESTSAVDSVGVALSDGLEAAKSVGKQAVAIAERTGEVVGSIVSSVFNIFANVFRNIANVFTQGFSGESLLGLARIVPNALIESAMMIGDATQTALKGPPRRLTDSEKTELRKLVGPKVDLDAVRVHEKSWFLGDGAGMTYGNTIFLGGEVKPSQPDPKNPSAKLPSPSESVLAHEMVHVVQYQTDGMDYASRALGNYAREWVAKGPDPYDWRRAVSENTPWEDLRVDEQAAFIQDAYAAGLLPPIPGAPIQYVVPGPDGKPLDASKHLQKAWEHFQKGELR